MAPKQTRRPGPIVVDRELIECSAFWDLRAKAVRVLVRFFGKRKRTKMTLGRRQDWVTTNDGAIVFTYAEAQGLGINPNAFRDILDDLVGHGFIRIARIGGRLHGGVTLYGISDNWRDWRPGIDPPWEKRKRDSRRLGFEQEDVRRRAEGTRAANRAEGKQAPGRRGGEKGG